MEVKAVRTLKKLAKGSSLSLFAVAQRFGLFIAPRHYYVPLAAWSDLKKNQDDWNRPLDLSSIYIDLDDEIATLNAWTKGRQVEVAGNPVYKAAAAAQAGPGYGYIEAQMLHCAVRAIAPPRIIEVGSGVSTQCMLAAASSNQWDGRSGSRITCVEPYPSAALQGLPVTLIRRPVEQVELAVFDDLKAGDLLFIDSSHAVRPCGDVVRLYLEVLPRLAPGVHVHIHDIYLPYAFQRDLKTYMQWMETAMLMAVLSHSPRYKVALSLSHLHYTAPEALRRALPEYEPEPNNGGLSAAGRSDEGRKHFPASTYITVL
jgi:predicted O-methyltransferase YrrM